MEVSKGVIKAAYVVGVGASAGGLEALTLMFRNSPRRTGICFVVVQHLSPDYKSLMAELLAQHTELKVKTAKDGLLLAADTIYMIRPRTEIRVKGGRLQVNALRERRALDPINLLFASLAKQFGKDCAAVVLSGTGSDGSEGLAAVRKQGGLTIVQQPESAGFDGMPRSALATGMVDWVLDANEIIHELVDTRGEIDSSDLGSDDDYNTTVPRSILVSLRTQTGLDFNYYKPSTIRRRIERRMNLLGMSNAREYADRLKEDSVEADNLQRDMLIGVTRFLRDPGAIETVRRIAIPRLVAQPGSQPLRLWVPGCSTGEEAYSLAMLLQIALEEAGSTRDFKIFATDIDENALTAAGRGTFSAASVARLPKPLPSRYFRPRGKKFVVTRELRDRLLFSRHNVITDPPFLRMDMVSCRNLLIYLKPRIQDRVVRLFSNSLTSSGLLWLGSSESLSDQSTLFTTLDVRWKLFEGKPQRNRSPVSVGLAKQHSPSSPAIVSSESGMSPLAEHLLEGFLPPTILVTQSLQIKYRYGDLQGLLNVPDGKLSFDMRDMLPRKVAVLASTACQRAFRSGLDVVYSGLHIELVGGEVRQFDLVARRIPGPLEPLVALVFRGLAQAADTDGTVALSDDVELHVAELQSELRDIHENLQTTVEELESSNEEMQATNEELVAANEELQSTNEELQSVNEELHSVNAENTERVQELTLMTGDLNSLLGSLHVAIVFLDPQLCIRRYNRKASDYVNLLDADLGRPLAHLTHGLDYPTLYDDCSRVLSSSKGSVHQVSAGSRQVRVEIFPLSDRVHKPMGLVIAVTDITDLVTASAQAVQISRNLDAQQSPQCILDLNGRITHATPAFARLSGREPTALPGTPAADLSTKQSRSVVVRVVELALRGRAWSGLLPGERPDASRYWEVVHLIPNRNAKGQVVGAVRVSEDITQAIEAIKVQKANQQESPNESLGDHQTPEYFLWDAVSDTAHGTPGLCAYYGVDPAQPINFARTAVSPTDLVELLKAVRQGRKTGRPWNIKLRVKAADGEHIIETRGHPVDGPSGRNTRVLGQTWQLS